MSTGAAGPGMRPSVASDGPARARSATFANFGMLKVPRAPQRHPEQLPEPRIAASNPAGAPREAVARPAHVRPTKSDARAAEDVGGRAWIPSLATAADRPELLHCNQDRSPCRWH